MGDGPAVGGEVNGIGGGVFQEGEPQTDLLQFQLSQKIVVPVVCQQDALIEIGRIQRPQENIILGVGHISVIYIHGNLHRLLAGGLVVFTQADSGAVIVQHVVKVYDKTVFPLPVLKYPLDTPGLQVPFRIRALALGCLGQGKVEVPIADGHTVCWPVREKRDIFLKQPGGLPGLQLDLVDRQRIIRVRCAGECQEDEIAVVEEVAAAAVEITAEVLLLGQLGDDPVIGAVHVHLNQLKVILKRDTVKMAVVISEGHL